MKRSSNGAKTRSLEASSFELASHVTCESDWLENSLTLIGHRVQRNYSDWRSLTASNGLFSQWDMANCFPVTATVKNLHTVQNFHRINLKLFRACDKQN